MKENPRQHVSIPPAQNLKQHVLFSHDERDGSYNFGLDDDTV